MAMFRSDDLYSYGLEGDGLTASQRTVVVAFARYARTPARPHQRTAARSKAGIEALGTACI